MRAYWSVSQIMCCEWVWGGGERMKLDEVVLDVDWPGCSTAILTIQLDSK